MSVAMEDAELARLLYALNARLDLPKKQRSAMLTDFRMAAERLTRNGLAPREASERLDPARLGEFNLRRPDRWYPLDDAAKIYPMSMTDGWMSVFRLSAYLDGEVEPELLQAALHFTLPRFPFFATRVRCGLFWHYIEDVNRRFEVSPETELPCAPMDISGGGSQAFRVMYYKNRVSVEFFHILTDGTGGLRFLTALVTEYLRLRGDIRQTPVPQEAEPDGEESENAFKRFAAECGQAQGGYAGRPAVRLRGKQAKQRPARILHFGLDAVELKKAARERQASVTALILAFMTEAAHAASDESHGDICIQVPVNMRKFCPSKTLRNFSMYCAVSTPWQEAGRAGDILPQISAQLRENASEGAMRAMLAQTAATVRALGGVPLLIKRPAARFAYGLLGERAFTSTLSNLGRAELPPETAKHVEALDFVLGTGEQSRAACALVTLGERATLTITKLTEDPAFETRLLELLEAAGLSVELSGSMVYGA